MPSKPRRPLASRAADHSEPRWGSQLRRGELYRVKHPSAILCDVLTSFPRSQLTDYVGTLGPTKIAALRTALKIAVNVE